jgi:hypothetical protein
MLNCSYVILRKSPLKKDKGTLFQQFFNKKSSVLTAAMLHDRNTVDHVNVDNLESTNFGKLTHVICINEHELEKPMKLWQRWN